MLRRLVIWLSVLMACALLYRSSTVWCEDEAPAAAEDEAKEETKAEGEKPAEEAKSAPEAGEEAKAEEKPAAEGEAKGEDKAEQEKPAEEAMPTAEAGEEAKAEEKPVAEGEAKEETKAEGEKLAAESAEDKEPLAEKATEEEAQPEKAKPSTALETVEQPKKEERLPWWRRGRRAVNYEDENKPTRRDEGRATTDARQDRKKSEAGDKGTAGQAAAASVQTRDNPKRDKIKEMADTIRASLDYRAQSKAAQGIIAFGPPTTPEVLALLNDSAPLVRVFGVLILRELKDQAAVAALWGLLNDSDAQIRYHAGMALTKITGRNLGYYYNENPEDRQIAIQRVAEILVQGGYMPAPAKVEKQQQTPAAPTEQKSGLEVVSDEKATAVAPREAKAEKPVPGEKVKALRRKKQETPVAAQPSAGKNKAAEPIKAEEVGSSRPPKWESGSPRHLPNPDDY